MPEGRTEYIYECLYCKHVFRARPVVPFSVSLGPPKRNSYVPNRWHTTQRPWQHFGFGAGRCVAYELRPRETIRANRDVRCTFPTPCDERPTLLEADRALRDVWKPSSKTLIVFERADCDSTRIRPLRIVVGRLASVRGAGRCRSMMMSP